MSFEEAEIEKALRLYLKIQEKIDEEKRLERMTNPNPQPLGMYSMPMMGRLAPWYRQTWWQFPAGMALNLIEVSLLALLLWRLW